MKLFLYDAKHENVFGELDLGNKTKEIIDLLDKVILFLGENKITNRYNSLVVADGYTKTIDDDESVIEFVGYHCPITY